MMPPFSVCPGVIHMLWMLWGPSQTLKLDALRFITDLKAPAGCSEVLWGSLRFSEVLWGSLRLSEVLWGCLRFSEVLWGALRFSEVLWGSLRFSEVLWGSLRFSEVVWGCLRLSEVLWGSLRFSEVLWGSLRCSEVLWGALRCSEVLWGSLRCSEVLWGSLRCSEVLCSCSAPRSPSELHLLEKSRKLFSLKNDSVYLSWKKVFKAAAPCAQNQLQNQQNLKEPASFYWFKLILNLIEADISDCKCSDWPSCSFLTVMIQYSEALFLIFLLIFHLCID